MSIIAEILRNPSTERARITSLAVAVTLPNSWQAIRRSRSLELSLEILGMFGHEKLNLVRQLLHEEERATLWRVQAWLILSSFERDHDLTAPKFIEFMRINRKYARYSLGINAQQSEVQVDPGYLDNLLRYFQPATPTAARHFHEVLALPQAQKAVGRFAPLKDVESAPRAWLPAKHAKPFAARL